MAAAGVVTRSTLEVFGFEITLAMELLTILNHCHLHRDSFTSTPCTVGGV